LTGESVKRLFEDELSKPYGRRTVGDIVGRLVRQSRAADHPGEIVRASALLAELATVRGKSNDALDRARQVARSHGLGPESIELVERLVDGLQAHPLERDSIVFDFGLARDFSYYTGVIFEAHVIGGAEGQALGGGGRYDGLIQSLGGEDIPALGFAFTMEMVAEALQRSNEQPDGAPARREL
jgi:histidyl-tRNA synthetase